jgi:ribA/ribD-fused uncharacterized protein
LINCFDGKYAFLSNFYDSPITEDEITYPTVEHYFQAMKTLDKAERFNIATQPTPGKAKRCGRKVSLRSDWEQVKESVMETALRLKFSNPELKQKLLDTGDEWLEEGTTWHDNEWGSCHCQRCINIPGKNKLGYLLMKIRSELDPAKWHIFNDVHEPLCWEDRALDFDTQLSAYDFLHSAKEADSRDEEFWENITVQKVILYYDGGHLNATNKRVVYDYELEDTVLIDI